MPIVKRVTKRPKSDVRLDVLADDTGITIKRGAFKVDGKSYTLAEDFTYAFPNPFVSQRVLVYLAIPKPVPTLVNGKMMIGYQSPPVPTVIVDEIVGTDLPADLDKATVQPLFLIAKITIPPSAKGKGLKGITVEVKQTEGSDG